MIKENFDQSYISSFYTSSIQHLKEELEQDFSFCSNINKSCNFILKNRLTLSPNIIEKNNNDTKNLNIDNNVNNDKDKNNNWDFNTSPSEFFNENNKKNKQNNNIFNNTIMIDNEINKLNDNNIYDLKNETESLIIKNKELNYLEEMFHQKDNFEFNNENISTLYPYNLENSIEIHENNSNKQCIRNKEFFDNNFINQEFKLLENDINNNKDSILKNKFINKINITENNYSNKFGLNFNKINNNNENGDGGDINIKNLEYINEPNFEEYFIELNNQQSNYENNNNLYNMTNNLNNQNRNINYCINNKIINHYYINFINPVNQNKSISSLNNNEIPQTQDMTNINISSFGIDKDDLNPEDYLIKMFDKLGWICRLCDNFNFETRKICNRCKAVKTPKTKEEINKKKEINKNKKKIKRRKTDWLCLNCENLNYSFRKFCNRCKIERKEEFPSIYLEPYEKLNGKNNNIILMKNFNEIQNSLNKNFNNSSNNNNICYYNNTNSNNNVKRNYFMNNPQYFKNIFDNHKD